jgi:hypothetical protein
MSRKVINVVPDYKMTIIDIREHREELLMWDDIYKDLLFQGSLLVKINNTSLGVENKVILSTVLYAMITNNTVVDNFINSASAIAFFWDMKCYSNISNTTLTVKEITQQVTIDGKTPYDILMSFPQLTESEFYSE